MLPNGVPRDGNVYLMISQPLLLRATYLSFSVLMSETQIVKSVLLLS